MKPLFATIKACVLDGFTAIWWVHRQVMRVRFPMLAGVLVAMVFLFVQQGREILNVIAQPRLAQSLLFREEYDIGALTPGMNWGWIGTFWAGALALSVICWAFSRVLLGLNFTPPGKQSERGPLIGERTRTPWQAGLEDACEGVLPTVFGALPLVAIGCGLLLNAQSNLSGILHPAWLTWFCRVWPLVVIFGVPLVVLVGDGVLRARRAEMDQQREPSSVMGQLRRTMPVALAVPLVVSLGCAVGLDARRTCLEAAAFFALALTIYGIERVRPVCLGGAVIVLCTLWSALVPSVAEGGPVPHPWRTPEVWIGLIGGGFAVVIPLAFVWGQPNRRLGEGFTAEGEDKLKVEAMDLFAPKLLSAPAKGLSAFEQQQRFFTWLVTSALVYALCVAALIVSRTDLSRWAGSGAVLVLALGFWLCLLCGVQIAAQKERMPWLLLLALWAALCTLGNDNHAVRMTESDAKRMKADAAATAEASASGRGPVHPADVSEAYVRWSQVPSVRAAREKGVKPPLFVVVTEGGGVRAAFWTAAVLGSLQELSELQHEAAPEGAKPPVFRDHCFAISGVSGGSVGGTLFAALQTTQHPGASQETLDVLKEDLLSPLISGLVCNDWFQCVWFRPIPYLDRGARFEENLEERLGRYLGPNETNLLASPLLDMNRWRAEHPKLWTPYLFLNSTDVDAGHRVIFSDVGINTKTKEFADAEGGYARLGQKAGEVPGTVELPLSTAAHNSARFPYTNPTGRLPDRGRLTDGGLFENSGATTGREIAQAIVGPLEANGGSFDTKIVFVVVEFGDPGPMEQGRLSRYLLHGLLGPPTALLSTRTARASYATAALEERTPQSAPQLDFEVVRFKARTKRAMQPLGWQLSALAAREMYYQMPHELEGKAPINTFRRAKALGRAPVEEGYDEENRRPAGRVLEILAGAK